MSDQRPTDYQDELDVYEVVYRLGLEKGMQFLTPLQLQKLREAGRVEGEISHQNVKKSSFFEGIDTLIVQSMMQDVLVELSTGTTAEEWRALNEGQKKSLVWSMFKLKYKTTPSDVKQWLSGMVV